MTDKNKGLYKKFKVERTDGSSKHGGKHQNCRYYVLDLDHDKYSIQALRAYSEACEGDYPKLAIDLKNIVRNMEDALYASVE